MNNHESRITRLEVTIENINQTLASINRNLEHIDAKIEKLNDRLWTNFFWMIGGFASILAVIAHAFHWI